MDQRTDSLEQTDKLAKYSAFLTEFCSPFMAHIIVETLIFGLLLLTVLLVLFIPTLIARLIT